MSFYNDFLIDTQTYSEVNITDTLETFGYCPCPENDDDDEIDAKTWEVVVTSIVLVGMFSALITDYMGADSVMLTALTIFMATAIVTVPEGLAGFANEGLLTVLVLFIVADGISKTGALDWYMQKLLGRPNSAGSAQARLMLPIAFVSAFLNNTPVVAVMIPIVQKWGRHIGISPQQLLIPLSFASIFGGTCTLIGTSTNLIVKGLLDDTYKGVDSVSIGLFDLGQYGIPIAFVGMTYILIFSPFLLPGGIKGNQSSGANPLEDNDDILLGARMTQWSPAAGRTVKRSGLRDTGGIYLVSVHRYATGNVHRAVGQDFVLNAGDILYFTGLVEEFGSFCEEHGLEMVTNEIEDTIPPPKTAEPVKQLKSQEEDEDNNSLPDKAIDDFDDGNAAVISATTSNGTALPTLYEDNDIEDIPIEVGVTKESLMQADSAERLRGITRMTDMIRGVDRDESRSINSSRSYHLSHMPTTEAPKVVVTIERDLVVIGVDSRDRPGLLLDLSKGLLSLDLQLHHTEAAVVNGRSLSIWRCEPIGTEIADVEQVWQVMTALLQADNGILAVKKRGLRVIRARVTPMSRLIGRTVAEVSFRERYHAAIVAIQRGGKNINQPLSSVIFEAGDSLILQASDDSPLLRLKPPTDDFYKKLAEEAAISNTKLSRPNSRKSFSSLVKFPSLSRRPSQSESDPPEQKIETGNQVSLPEKAGGGDSDGEDFFVPSDDEMKEDGAQGLTSEAMGGADGLEEEMILRDLEVLVTGERGDAQPSREFLTAMEVAQNSNLAGKTVAQAGISKLPGAVLISIERPNRFDEQKKSTFVVSISRPDVDSTGPSDHDGTVSVRTTEPKLTPVELEEPLKEGDILWFAGSASAMGDLRKIPGLASYESEEVAKMNENVHDRRLVQAVVARQGPLVGKTVKEVRFRTRYGAAVIAVHREGKRILDHPGSIVLQAGDVLLLEAGSAFIGKSTENERSFALLSEVKDSAPPRLSLYVPALAITAIMLIVATLGVTSLLICALVAAILMVALGILSEQEARDAVNWDIFITIACAFGIGQALINSGIANACAVGLVAVGDAMGLGDAGLFGAVYLATMLISNIVTNNAAATLVFPIALNAAEKTGADRVLMSYCLMLGASASFMTPFGYTTNLMIYGPGGYKSKDFLKVGTPLQLGLWLFSTFLLATPSIWWVSWIVTSGAFVLMVFIRSRTSRK